MADINAPDAIETRKKYVEGWNNTMVDIWQDRIWKLKVIDTMALWKSLEKLPVHADGRYMELELTHNFLEYGIWQDLGTGKETPKGNPGDIGRAKVRKKRRWMSPKYYSSTVKLRDFMADSIGNEFKQFFCSSLDSDNLRYQSDYYRRKGYTR